jgi:hypothetical protein
MRRQWTVTFFELGSRDSGGAQNPASRTFDSKQAAAACAAELRECRDGEGRNRYYVEVQS